MTAPRKSAPRKAAAKKVAVKAPAADSADAVPAAPTGKVGAELYPKGLELFTFKAESGVEIVFPVITTRTQSRAFHWQLYNLPPEVRGFEWMREYEVPLEIQALAVDLPDKEYDALFDAWFAGAGLTAGE